MDNTIPEIKQVVRDLVEMEYQGHIASIAVSVITKEGNLITKIAIPAELGPASVGGVQMLSFSIINYIAKDTRPAPPAMD